MRTFTVISFMHLKNWVGSGFDVHVVQPFNEPVVVSVVGIATQLWCALFGNLVGTV